VLDLYISPRIDSDLIDSREFIPAYVSPEVLDKRVYIINFFQTFTRVVS
jgi:hypothetical protein